MLLTGLLKFKAPADARLAALHEVVVCSDVVPQVLRRLEVLKAKFGELSEHVILYPLFSEPLEDCLAKEGLLRLVINAEVVHEEGGELVLLAYVCDDGRGLGWVCVAKALEALVLHLQEWALVVVEQLVALRKAMKIVLYMATMVD